MLKRNKNKNLQGSTSARDGFTLIELLVVVAIIALLSSVTLIALIQARQKGRDTKRIGDLTQMSNAMELYFSTYKGYPSSASGIPQNVLPQFLVTIPTAPKPEDGVCAGLQHVCGGAGQPPCGVAANTYYYMASGTPYSVVGVPFQVYPDYGYYFCLGNKTGNYAGGEHWINPQGVH